MFGASFLRQTYFGNPVTAYLFGAVEFLAVLGGYLILRHLAARSKESLAKSLFEQIRPHELVFLALATGMRELDLPHRVEFSVHLVTLLVIAYRVVGLLSTLATFAIRRSIPSDRGDYANHATSAAVTLAAKCLIWLGMTIFVLSNAGYNVSSMVAGLGIGGIAVALAAQAVLGDFFAAIAIHLDKPFVTGDSIKVGDGSGTVERIGIKTTRVRSLDGEMLVYPNSMLTSLRIQNYRLLQERRSVVTFIVASNTPPETLRKIPGQLRAIIEKTSETRFDRAHLAQIQESGLRFEAVFFVTHPNYGVYMDRQQAVLLALLDALRADGVALVQPTRAVVIEDKKA